MFILPGSLIRTDWIFLLECVLFVPILVIAFKAPERIANWGRQISQAFRVIARRPFLVLILVAVLALNANAVVGLVRGIPEPSIHDEFSYVLAADTFRSGRLANLTHPLWRSFESLHIIQRPTYASKYPPGQGLALALGWVLGGHPAVGVWLSMAIACVCITWMLQAWVPARWALLGGFLATLNLCFFGYWSQNYWGGGVAIIGGALLFGSLRRILKKPSIGLALLLGCGLIVLAISRPLEGAVASIPAAYLLIRWLLARDGPPLRIRLTRVVLPLSLVVLAGGVWIAYYNYRVTGNPLKLPYRAYQETYDFVPQFPWNSLRAIPESCRHVFRQRQDEELAFYHHIRTLGGYFHFKWYELRHVLVFFFRFVFLIPLLTLPFLIRNRWVRFALLTSALVTICVFVEWMSMPRKLAPVTCLIVYLIIMGLRRLNLFQWKGRPTGACVVTSITGICALTVLLSFLPFFKAQPFSYWELDRSMEDRAPGEQRARILRELDRDSFRHLVIVRYQDWHWSHFDWIYNEASIDDAQVVWARELDDEQDERLLTYFKDRKVWLLDADYWHLGQLRLMPYHLVKEREATHGPNASDDRSAE